MSISSPRPYGNTSPGGATSPTLSCHSTMSSNARRFTGRRRCSRLAAAPRLTIIGPAGAEKALLGFEVPPRAPRRSAQTPVGGEAGGGTEVPSGLQHPGSPRQREKTLSGLTSSSSGPAIMRNMIQQVLPFISRRGGSR